MDTLKINNHTTAKQIASISHTAADCKGFYKSLCAAGMSAEKARKVTKDAAAIVNERHGIIRDKVRTAKAWYRDGENLIHPIFVEFIKSKAYKDAAKGLKFNGNEFDFINKYYPIVTKSGRPCKVETEFVDGIKFRRYRFVDTSRQTAFSRIFDGCLDGIKKIRTAEFNQIRIGEK